VAEGHGHPLITSDSSQAPPIWDSWIFKSNVDGFNVLTTNFWCKNVKFYELKQVMWQSNFELIDILNKFWTTLQTFKDIEFIKNICFKTPPIDNILPYLFYTNTKTIQHNKKIFEKKMIKYSHP
jgi:hypothetical protein